LGGCMEVGFMRGSSLIPFVANQDQALWKP
jgi:hypothetical protein